MYTIYDENINRVAVRVLLGNVELDFSEEEGDRFQKQIDILTENGFKHLLLFDCDADIFDEEGILLPKEWIISSG